MVPAGISLFGHFRQKDRIPFLSSFHQLVHVTGYLPVGNLCIDLRTVDVRMAHHLGDALYRDAGGQHQGSERMAGHATYINGLKLTLHSRFQPEKDLFL